MNNKLTNFITGSNKYAGKTIYFKSLLTEENKKLVDLLKDLNIEKLNMTSVGNSIASGYSVSDSIKPLLSRNESLYEMLENNNIKSELNIFARCQNNREDKSLSYMFNNTKKSELNKYNRSDYMKEDVEENITVEEVYKYFPIEVENDKGLDDIILEKEDNLANIIVSCCCTGSFLDNITRGGKILNKGFQEDLISIECVLKYIYYKNPYTQVYVSGIPNFLNISITNIVNNRIKSICDKYVNSTYVESVPAHLFYNKDNKIVVDLHHNENEYLNLNNNFISAINDNYLDNMLKTEMHLLFSSISSKNEVESPKLKNDSSIIEEKLNNLLLKYKPYYEKQEKSISDTTKNFIKNYKNNYHHNYFYNQKKTLLIY